MVKKAAALLLALLLTVTAGGADPVWKQNTDGQRMLVRYLTKVNEYLLSAGESPINSLFEMYNGTASFGITDQPDAEIPEDVEITALLFPDTVNRLVLRVSDPDRFPRIAGAFLRALEPDRMTAEEAVAVPYSRARKAASAPATSFEDTVEELNGTVPYVYYAYYPDQYHDSVSWLQMTVVFPMAGAWDGDAVFGDETATRAPDTYSGHSDDYEGYYSDDDYSHLEIFVTPTPEPDSAAGENAF